MTREQLNALIDYINAKVECATTKSPQNADRCVANMVAALETLEESTEQNA